MEQSACKNNKLAYSAIEVFELIAWNSLKYILPYFVAIKNVALSIKRHLLCSFYQFLGQTEILNFPILFLAVLFLDCTLLYSRSGKRYFNYFLQEYGLFPLRLKYILMN